MASNNTMKSFLYVLVAFTAAMTTPAMAATVEVNLQAKYGVTQPGFARVIRDAKKHFAANPNDTFVVVIPAGTYFLTAPANHDKGIIELSGIKPGPKGRLVFRGAGMDKTVLAFDRSANQIYGRGVYRVSFIGMTMTRKECSVSQGHVVSVAPGQVVLDIQSGFSTPQDIYEPGLNQGRYLRQFTDSRTDPQLILENNAQIPWKTAEPISGRRWRLHLLRANLTPHYQPGDLIGIKSKHGGQPYWLHGGSDFIFEDLKWLQESRGVFRGGFDKVRITGCVVDRLPPIDGQTPCLSTPGGGPQIGQPDDLPTTGNLVENFRMTGTGYDSVAFFNASGTIRNCQIADCFGRGILLYDSPDVLLENNTLIRSVVLQQAKQSPRPPRTNWHHGKDKGKQ